MTDQFWYPLFLFPAIPLMMTTLCFGVAVVLFMIAIITFIVEIQLSVGALKKHLEDLEDL